MDIIVFTNGCFDIIHPGHIDLLKYARSLGTKLIVGINSDRSVKEIKGASRPLLNQEARAAVLRELRAVDEVRIFDENTPERIIREINPHVLVKGGDWQVEQIIGADFVTQNGGRVFSIPFKQNISTSRIVEKMRMPEGSIATGSNSQLTAVSGEIRSHPVSDGISQLQVTRVLEGAALVSQTILNERQIWIAGMSPLSGAQRLSQNLESCSGRVRILQTEIIEESAARLRGGDLLVVVAGFNETVEDFANLIIKARDAGCKIIVITGATGKKLAALSDVCIRLQTKLAGEIWMQAAIGYLWCRTADL